MAASLGIQITKTNKPQDLDRGIAQRVLVVGFTGAGRLTAQQPIIEAFVKAGGGLLIHQPNVTGTVDYAPPGFEVTIASGYWCNFPSDYRATIVAPTQYITEECWDDNLSAAGDSVEAVGSGYVTLAVSAVCRDVALAAGTFGLGRVVFDTGNGGVVAMDRGSDLYWAKVFGWLASQRGSLARTRGCRLHERGYLG